MKGPLLYIGCSGYYYSYWRNKFYPQGLKPAQWLSHYSTIFNTVELNGTFYRKPTLAALQKYAAATGDDFKFSVKMSRFVTHIKRLKDCQQGIDEFHSLIEEGLGNKLSCVLYQMPPSFQYNDENIDRVLEAIACSPNNVIEFRHVSWWNEDVYKALKKHKITMCNVDFPGLETPIVDTSPNFYLRMHGTPVLFKSSYDLDALQQFTEQLPAKGKTSHIYFNNTYYEAGYTNAMQLKQIVATDKSNSL